MEKCEACGYKVELLKYDWATYGNAYESELVAIYKCGNKKCRKEFEERDSGEVYWNEFEDYRV